MARPIMAMATHLTVGTTAITIRAAAIGCMIAAVPAIAGATVNDATGSSGANIRAIGAALQRSPGSLAFAMMIDGGAGRETGRIGAENAVGAVLATAEHRIPRARNALRGSPRPRRVQPTRAAAGAPATDPRIKPLKDEAGQRAQMSAMTNPLAGWIMRSAATVAIAGQSSI